MLPQKFEYQEAAMIGEQLKISNRTTRNYLYHFIEAKLLLKEEHGQYAKKI